MINPPEEESHGITPIPLETLVVDQEMVKELLCGICLQILNRPKQCKNGHLFCHSCIAKYLQKKKEECPQCRCSLKESELARSLFVEKHLRMLQVHCKYHFIHDDSNQDWKVDPDGCTEIAASETMGQHEKNCPFAPVTCKYSSKCEKLRRKELEAHEESCPYRPLRCQHCESPVESKKMEEHLSTCGMLPITCPKCEFSGKRSDVEIHVKNDCPEATVPCQFADQGCKQVLLRKELCEHLGTNAGAHLAMMKKAFDDQLATIKTTFDTQLKVRDDKIKLLEKALSDNETRVEWRVKNWTTVRKKSYLQSEKFVFADFSWFIGFYTDGDNDESRGYISLYLFLDLSSIPKGKFVTVEFTLKFINHKDPNEAVRKEFKTTFPIKGGQGWGDRKAIKVSKLCEEAGFVKDDVLTVEVHISLKKVHWSLH